VAEEFVPGTVSSLRKEAGERFAAIALPTSRDEDWKHTPLGDLSEREFHHADAPAAVDAAALPAMEGATRLVFVDGVFAPALSAPADEDGFVAGGLRDALAALRGGVPEWLGRCADFETRGIAALNTAHLGDGAFLHAGRGRAVEHPVHVVHVATPAAGDRIVPLRSLVVAEPGSGLRVVEHFVRTGDAACAILPVTEVAVGDGARVAHTKLSEEREGTVHLASVDAIVGRDGFFGSRAVTSGGATARTETRVRLDGRGAGCDLRGVNLARDSRLTDQLTVVDHAVPDCTSNQVYRAIVDGKARSVFNGLVIVRKDAQRTAADQSSRNLVLSPTADAHARPQLDISADDVKCSHGATIGALDPEALFYLRSRGIGAEEARRLRVRAFAGDALAGIEEGPVRAEMDRILTEWLDR